MSDYDEVEVAKCGVLRTARVWAALRQALNDAVPVEVSDAIEPLEESAARDLFHAVAALRAREWEREYYGGGESRAKAVSALRLAVHRYFHEMDRDGHASDDEMRAALERVNEASTRTRTTNENSATAGATEKSE